MSNHPSPHAPLDGPGAAPVILAPGIEIFVGLGGNLGGHHAICARFDRAVGALEAELASGRARRSSIYQSEPVGPVTRQPRFLNAVVSFALGRAMTPNTLLDTILAIEVRLGRVRNPAEPKGPRKVDLDLLFAGDCVATGPGLSLPHPRMIERAFVLRPLAELVGVDWPMPGFARTVAECLAGPEPAAQSAGVRLYVPPGGADGRYSRSAWPR